MKKRTRAPLLLFLVPIILVNGCSQPLTPQYLGFGNIEISKAGIRDSRVATTLKFYNPNNYGLQLKHADVIFLLDDRQVGHCIIDSTIYIPKLDSFFIPVSAQINLNNILGNAIKLLLKGKTKINAEGYVKLKKSGVSFKIPVHYQDYESLDFLLQQMNQ